MEEQGTRVICWFEGTELSPTGHSGHHLPVNDAPQGPLDVHAMAHTRHAQVQVVVLGEGGQVRAVDLVVQETLSVLTQVQVAKPIRNVVLGPVWQRLGGKRLRGGRRW